MLRLTTAVLAACLTFPAIAGEGGDIAVRHLYAGTSKAGIAELSGRSDPESRFGIGLLQFVRAIEHLGQGLYRYGYQQPPDVLGAAFLGPTVPFSPVPPNPNPEPVDYDKLRGVVALLVEELDAAQATLREAGVEGDFVVPVDVMKVALDLNSDGKSGQDESIGAIMAAMMGGSRLPVPPELGSMILGLDRADAFWLSGYINIVAVQAEFLLAHDFSKSFDATYHSMFPGSDLPLSKLQRAPRDAEQGLVLDLRSEMYIADLIAGLHLFNWPVVEPDRLKRVRERLLTVTALSRQNWAAINAETDDDRELLPNPKQTAAIGQARVSEEQVAAWLTTLDTLDQVLEGKLLLPHWRFEKGIDLKSYFETATYTDAVMLITGYDAIPYLKDGPVAGPESFEALTRAFGDDWLGYAFWFN